ncbi:MAG: ATP-binding protein [Planctomycetota bacterium]
MSWAAANLSDLLGVEAERALGRPLSELLSPRSAARVLSACDPHPPYGEEVLLAAEGLRGRVQCADGVQVLELFPCRRAPEAPGDRTSALLLELAGAQDEQSLLDAGAAVAARLTGFRDVRVRRRDPASYGEHPTEVVVESLAGPLVPVLAHRPPDPLDLSRAWLRAQGPTTREGARFSFPLAAGGRVWGALVGVHPAPRSVEAAALEDCRTLARVLAARLQQLEDHGALEAARSTYASLLHEAARASTLPAAIEALTPSLSGLISCTQLLLCRSQGNPEEAALDRLAGWLRAHGHGAVTVLDDASGMGSALGPFADSRLLAAPLGPHRKDWVVWRRERGPQHAWTSSELAIARELSAVVLPGIVSLRRGSERRSAALVRSNEDLVDFAQVVAHDLKAPLRNVAALASWVREDYQDSLDQEGATHLSMIEARVDALSRMIEGVLDFSRVDTSRSGLESLDTSALVERIVETLEVPPGIELSVADDLPRVEFHEVNLERVFTNLLANALRFAESRIEVGARRRGRAWEFFVRDDGPGVAPAYQARVFELFGRDPQAPGAETFRSTGVGLAVVRKIVDAGGGEVWVESPPGEGATFRFTVLEAPLPERAKQVLVVEDDPDEAELLCQLLSGQGHDCACARSVEHALEHLERHRVDVAVVDLVLPDGSGCDVLRHLRERDDRPVLSIAITGRTGPAFRRQARAAGFDHFASKPVDMDVLNALIA